MFKKGKYLDNRRLLRFSYNTPVAVMTKGKKMSFLCRRLPVPVGGACGISRLVLNVRSVSGPC
jgi:hypothetical protein